MDSSSFDNDINNNPFSFTDIEPIKSNGATSDTYKVLIYGKWHFLKRPKKIYSDNPLYLSAFQKEFEIGYTLDHPNIVRYIIKGEDLNGLYILTDYVDGFTLADFIKSNPNYIKDDKHLEKFLNQLLSALKYLHERQILHLDLKPENILITGVNNDVKLVDFGFSYTDCFSYFTIGKTALYAAPEQLLKEEVDQRTDIYGIGKILEFIFGKGDFKTSSIYRSLIDRCLSENKEDRFNNISEIQKYISHKSKSKNKITYSVATLGLLVISALIYQFSIRNNTEYYPIPINETVIHKIDTVYVVDSVRQIGKKESADYSLMAKEVKHYTDSIFNDLEEQYKEITLNNYQDFSGDYEYTIRTVIGHEFGDSISFKYRDVSPKLVKKLLKEEIESREHSYKIRYGNFISENYDTINAISLRKRKALEN